MIAVLCIKAVFCSVLYDNDLKGSFCNGLNLFIVETVVVALCAAQIIADIKIPVSACLSDDNVCYGERSAALCIF